MVIGSVFDRIRSGVGQRRADLEARLLPRVFRPATGRRQRARLLAGAYDEWGILYSPHGDVTQSSAALTEFAIRSIDRTRHIDLAGLADRATRETERVDVVTWPGEHYQLLAGLAEVWGDGDPISVVEVGTYTGASALALLSTPSVEQVITFDLAPWDSFEHTMLRAEDFGARLEQRLDDLSDPDTFAAHASTLASADIVFVDAPKDGQFEYQFLPWLFAVEPERSQLVVLDDVRVVPMINLWRSLPLPKLDVASFGHWSGTGLVIRDRAVHWTPPSSRLARDVRPLLRRRWRQH